jgi:selenocysteine lyase/cysteine desulfurase
VLNAANLCPSSAPVLDALFENTRDMDRDPSPQNRVKMGEGKETTRQIIADFLRVTPEEILITRNTSEASNMVSSGVHLGEGDEIVLFADNHPSNKRAWESKSERYGFTIKELPNPNPHPGPEYYIKAVTDAITPRTRVVAVTHLTSTVGDLMPAKEICRIAREREVLTLLDGAQTFGLLDVDLSDIQPDFYSGSAHKWPCGAKEAGVLFVNQRSQDKIWPTILSAYSGRVGISRTHEGFGQRDEPAIIAFGEALKLQTKVGRQAIEKRSQQLAQLVIKELGGVDGVTVWTSPDPSRSSAVVSFLPGNLDIRKLSAALYENDRIACATRGGQDRGGLRFSPHFYNLQSEVERGIAAVKKYMAQGV